MMEPELQHNTAANCLLIEACAQKHEIGFTYKKSVKVIVFMLACTVAEIDMFT